MLRGNSIQLVLFDEHHTPMSSAIQVNYNQATACILEAFRAKEVPYLKGSPGIGKSGIYAMVAKMCKLKLIDLRLASYEPTDLLGFPHIDSATGKAGYLPFDVFPLEGDEIPEGYVGFLLLLDEINGADRSVIKAAYKVVHDHMVGPHKLHEKCVVGLAGNLDSDNALTEEMGTAMQSRISPHLELVVDNDQWLLHANTNATDYRIISFLDLRPDLLHHFEPDHVDCTYPCPRTWMKVHKYINGQELHGKRLKNIYTPLLAGTIGSGAALEFIAFCAVFGSLPSMAELLADPENVKYTDSPDVIYALTGMLSHNAKPENIDSMLSFISRLDGEFQALAIKNIRQRHAALNHHLSITTWLADNAESLVA